MARPVIRDRFSDRVPVTLDTGDESYTRQEFYRECDINRMMAKYMKTGVPPVGVGLGRYGDFSSVEDFMQAQEIVRDAVAQFSMLPSKVRERFGNDPSRFLAFIADKANLEEARKLGLLKEEPAPIKPLLVEIAAGEVKQEVLKTTEVKPA